MAGVFDTVFETLWPLWASTYKGRGAFSSFAAIERSCGEDSERTGQFETICDEFEPLVMSFESFRTICGRIVVTGDD